MMEIMLYRCGEPPISKLVLSTHVAKLNVVLPDAGAPSQCSKFYQHRFNFQHIKVWLSFWVRAV